MADQPLGQKLIKKWFWMYVFAFFAAPVWYLIKVIVSNGLSVEDVGLFYSVMWFVTLVSTYHDLWLTEALQYFLPKYWINKEYDNYKTTIYLTLAVQVFLWIIVAVLMYFGADWLAIHHFKSPMAADVLKTLCIFFVGVNFLQVFSIVFVSFQDTISGNFVETLRMYAVLIFTFIFWITHSLTLDTFAYSWIIWLFLALITSTLFFVIKYGHTLKKWTLHFNKSVLTKQIKYALWVFLGANIGSLLAQIDQQLVINLLGPEQAGYYTNFFSLVMIYSIVVGPFLTLIFPIVTELIIKKDYVRFGLYQNILYKYFGVLSLSLGFFFLVFGPVIAQILFGFKFEYSGHLLRYIGPFLIFNVLYIINYWILAGLGKVQQRVKILWITLIVNVACNFFLISFLKIGLLGAVISLIISWLLMWFLSFRIVNKHLTIVWDIRFFLINMCVIAGVMFIFYFLKNQLLLNDVYRLRNLGYLFLFLFVYYWILAAVNYKSIRALIGEVKAMRKSV